VKKPEAQAKWWLKALFFSAFFNLIYAVVSAYFGRNPI
jgi:hypothetical protein